MSEYAQKAPHHLSGGQKKRVAIAGILAMNPECIIFDESTAMLDPLGRREVLNSIIKLNREKGITVVMITHYMDEAAQADRIIVMDNGSVCMDDIPENICSRRDEMVAMGLDVPQVTEFMYELNKNGIDIDYDVLTVTECADIILDYVRSVKSGN